MLHHVPVLYCQPTQPEAVIESNTDDEPSLPFISNVVPIDAHQTHIVTVLAPGVIEKALSYFTCHPAHHGQYNAAVFHTAPPQPPPITNALTVDINY